MKAEKQVRYVSPFGSPAYMSRAQATRLLAEDDARWMRLLDIERETGESLRSARQREVGGPRIEVHA